MHHRSPDDAHDSTRKAGLLSADAYTMVPASVLRALLSLLVAVHAWKLDSVVDLPTYFISLPRRGMKEVFQSVKEQFPRAELFNAVDGKTIDLVHDSRISYFARQNIAAAGRRSHAELNSAGGVGAYLSHVAVMRAFLATKPSNESGIALVLEDDTNVQWDTPRKLLNVAGEMPPPSSWDMWLLAGRGISETRTSKLAKWQELPPSARLVDVLQFWGLQAYVVSAHGAARIVDTAYPIVLQFDGHLSSIARVGDITVLWRADEPINLKERYGVKSTIQIGCDVCELPSTYSRPLDVLFWVITGLIGSYLAPRMYRYARGTACACGLTSGSSGVSMKSTSSSMSNSVASTAEAESA